VGLAVIEAFLHGVAIAMKQPSILVACDDASNAEVVAKLLRSEFDHIATATEENAAERDFEKHRPQVLVLAFDTLEKAERYCLRLYRKSPVAQTFAHRTVILCSKEAVRRAYDLCRRGCFDDYVLFWPLNYDAPRLPMAVLHALREISGDSSSRQIVDGARQVAQLDDVLTRRLEEGRQHIDAVAHTVDRAGMQMSSAVDELAADLACVLLNRVPGSADYDDITAALRKIKSETVTGSMHAIASALEPMRNWNIEVRRDVQPALSSARTISRSMRPLVMIVAHEGSERAELVRILEEEPVEVVAVSSVAEMRVTLRRRRTNLVLMDTNVPDIGGLQAIGNLTSLAPAAHTAVILISRYSKRDVVVNSIRAGAVDFIVKPVHKAVLLKKVRKYLAGK
jgi:DNA-binding NtrC family response regulator